MKLDDWLHRTLQDLLAFPPRGVIECRSCLISAVGFYRFSAAAPLLGQIAAKNAFASAATALGKDPRQNVYTRLGVKTIINCRGTWTYLSGSLEFPEVQAAQREASGYFVNMFELQTCGQPTSR